MTQYKEHKAVWCFDLDGTLIDSYCLIASTWKQVLGRWLPEWYGVPWPTFKEISGANDADRTARLELERFSPTPPIFLDTFELLTDLHKRGHMVQIVTAASYETAALRMPSILNTTITQIKQKQGRQVLHCGANKHSTEAWKLWKKLFTYNMHPAPRCVLVDDDSLSCQAAMIAGFTTLHLSRLRG